jgi:hypothetical protein
MAIVIKLTGRRSQKSSRGRIFFSRQELRQLLDVYSRRVARGEWRDYAIDHDGQAAVFSVFRHSYDSPLFSVSKSDTGKASNYTVFYGRRKIKQDPSLVNVLKVFDRFPQLVSTP